MSKHQREHKEHYIPRTGPAENLRPAGSHENKNEKKKERKIKEALHKLDFDQLEEL